MSKGKWAFNRGIRYVVTPVEVVRANNIRSEEEVREAQNIVDDDMIEALEEMVNAAKAGTLEKESLRLGAAAW